MAEFTNQQKSIISSELAGVLVNAPAKTGKTVVLERCFRNQQPTPDSPKKALFITANCLATTRVKHELQQVSKAKWDNELIGTLPEIGWMLVQRFYSTVGYSRPPNLVFEVAVATAKEQARLKAIDVAHDPANPAFKTQWDAELLQILRRQNIATPYSLTLEVEQMFTRLNLPELEEYQFLVVDNAHDLPLQDLICISALQERMPILMAGNTNIAISDRFQNLDSENWATVTAQDGFKSFSLSQSFKIGPEIGVFMSQLAAYNSRRIIDPNLTFQGPAQKMVELPVSSQTEMIGILDRLDDVLHLRMRQHLVAVVTRTPNDAWELSRKIKKPAFVQRDRTGTILPLRLPPFGVICTTPYEVPYIQPDYVVVASCLNGYWPYRWERFIENSRRAFIRAICPARLGVFFVIPEEPSSVLSSSPFLSEGNNPRLVTRSAKLDDL